MRHHLLGFITSFQLIPYRNLLVSLIFYANGCVTYYVKGVKHKAFKYLIFPRNRFERKLTKHAYISWIAFFKKLSILSLVELIPGSGVKYCRSSGTFIKLKKFNFYNKSAILKFQKTNVIKIASIFSVAMFGAISLKKKKKSRI